MKKLTAIVLTMVMSLVLVLAPGGREVQAASKYIKVDAFIKSLVISLKLPIDTSFPEPYIAAAVSTGLLTGTEFDNNWTAYLTRSNAAVVLNNTDEYLHGDTVKAELLKVVQKKRISDINKISKGQREAVAKIVAKGIIKGYSNGYYIQNREFRGTGKVTKSSAKTLINLVLNPKKRAKISPDGMLIRTTNLPKNAKRFDYILACYPNKFYERQFEFMLYDNYKRPTYKPYWAYPVEMKNRTFKNWYNEWPLKQEMDANLYQWADMAEKYLNYIFNVDYRTVDDKWIEGLGAMYVKSNRNEADDIRSFYLKQMKTNHVIVESSIIAVEPSIFYEDDEYCMRAYVKYRVTATNMNVDQFTLIYSQKPAFNNLKSGKWREGIFDIRFGTNNGSSGDGSDFAIYNMTNFVDAYNIPAK